MSQLELQDIAKSFSGVEVLRGVDFSVHSGEVHALLGSNGAGKSTLMNILAGIIPPDRGFIRLDGRTLTFREPADARREGIVLVVQEADTGLFPHLSVAENVVVDRWLEGPHWIGWKQVHGLAAERLQALGAELDPAKSVHSCTLAEKQLILLARALGQQTRFLILDEPTASLSRSETARLFQAVRRLKEKGTGIIYITHRLHELGEFADRVTLLRDGKAVVTRQVADLNLEEAVRDWFGSRPATRERRIPPANSLPLLEAEHFYIPRTGKHISLQIHAGEIVGIAGLVGAGKTETARALFGADENEGTLLIKGRPHRIRSPRDAIQAGICLVPEERRKEGILTDFPAAPNFSLPSLSRFCRFGFIHSKKEEGMVHDMIQRLNIRTPSPALPLKHWSGGNQQKAVLGKWLQTESDVWILDEPTKGIDTAAKEEVFQWIRSLADAGKGVLYLTADAAELAGVADRVLVMIQGEITGELSGPDITAEQITFAMGGVQAWNQPFKTTLSQPVSKSN
jgi:simple sugar transport system ATP-binding protein